MIKQKKSIRFKIIILNIVTLFTAVLITIFVSGYFFQKYANESLENRIKNKIVEYKKNIHFLGKKGVYSSSVLASLDSVKKAYLYYYKNKNLKKASNILKKRLRNLSFTVDKHASL